ncbi:hypothetical protein Btru_037278 [Bulinus truncatus]|nr:hypothetical protein Btru_037278 [Bulinus truncatus]
MNQTDVPETSFRFPEGDVLSWHIGEIVLYPTILIVGTVSNLVVLYINHFRSPSNTDTLFKKTIAAFDLIGLVFFLPLAVYTSFVPESPYYTVCCRVLSFFALWSLSTIARILVVIAIDRFLKLCLLRQAGLSAATVRTVLMWITILNTLMNLPCIWLFTRVQFPLLDYQVSMTCCFVDLGPEMKVLLDAFSVYIPVSTAIVLATLLILYAKIIAKLRELSISHGRLMTKAASSEDSHQAPGEAEGSRGSRQSRAMRKSSLVFIAVTVTYFLCYVPYGVAFIAENSKMIDVTRFSPLMYLIYDLCKMSPTVSHVTNPLIFLFSSPQVSVEVKAILACKFNVKDCFKRRVNRSTTHRPATHTPASHIPITHRPATQRLDTHTPASHITITHRPATQRLDTHTPASPIPIIHRSATLIPATHRPASHIPITHRPATQRPDTHTPASHLPITHRSATLIPATHRPASHIPITHSSATQRPDTHTPASHIPITHRPATQRLDTHTPASHIPITHRPATQRLNTHRSATQRPDTHTPASHIPITHRPATQRLDTHTPASHIPITHTPATQRLNTHTPASHIPITHRSANLIPATRTPASHIPIIHRSATLIPATHRPASNIPITHRSATLIPATHTPASHIPITHRPATLRPATHRPASHRTITHRPATQRPATQRPATQRPATHI